VLQELTPGKGRNSFSFVDGNVNGRELFVTTRKPAAKRARPRKKKDENGEVNETQKRGRPRKRDDPATPGTTTPKGKTPTKRNLPQEVTEPIDLDDLEVVHLPDETEASQAEAEETQGLSDGDEGGFETTTNDDDVGGFETTSQDFNIDFEAPTRDNRDETPLPVEPYRSFHSSPPSSPVYEEYQVPIPTSSSPVRPSSEVRGRPQSPTSPLQTPTPNDHARRKKARSRSASRERRMSFAPIPEWQGLPSTPRRTGSQESEESDRVSQSTKSTEIPSPIALPPVEVRQAVYNESMTPLRNWVSELTTEAFQSDHSPSKILQLPIASQVRMIPSVTVKDEDQDQENDYTDEEHGYMEVEEQEEEIAFSYSNTFLKDSPSTPKPNPQISRLRDSPIVITSSPPDQPGPVHYQWKTKVVSPLPIPPHPQETSSSPQPVSECSSSPEISLSQCRPSSRQSSPARSILTDLGDDVVDISSMSPLAARRAANILLRTQCYSKITFDDDQGRKVWEEANFQAGDFELRQLDLPSETPSVEDEPTEEEQEEEEEEEENEEMKVDDPEPPPRISEGPWGKLDWKRMEKCLDLTDGDINDAIELFLERYIGRGREEVEMRCRAVLLTRRRKALEGRKVEFVLATDE